MAVIPMTVESMSCVSGTEIDEYPLHCTRF
jgi:hypothetical protein